MVIRVHLRSSAASILLLLWSGAVVAQSPFLPGEATDYDISWNVFSAGKARMTVAEVPDAPHPTWRATVEARSAGIVSKLYSVDDIFKSTFHAGTICSEQITKLIHEGNRQRDIRINFDSTRRMAVVHEIDLVKNRTVREAENPVPTCAFDVLSALYFVRTLKLDVGKPFQVALNDGGHTMLIDVEVQAKEEIKTPAGTFKTIRIEPHVFGGTLFKKSGRMQIWLTDDASHRMVQLKARLFFGNITAIATK